MSRSRLVGANREYIEREIPHIWSLVRQSLSEVLEASEALIIGNRSPEFRGLGPRLRDGQVVVDLVRAVDGEPPGAMDYRGLSW